MLILKAKICLYYLKCFIYSDQGDGIVGKAFVCHMADTGLISSTAYGFPSLAEMISKNIARSKS